MPTATFDLISTSTLSTAASSVTISSIPSSYRDLVFDFNGIATSGTYYAYITTNLNTGTYYYVYAGGYTSSYQSSATGDNKIQIPAQGSYWSANSRILITGEIFDYTQSDKHKMFMIRSGDGSGATEILTAREPSTGTISSITVTINLTTFQAGSVFTLWGIAA